MKSINIRYFALLREEAGLENETIEVNCKSHTELYDILKARHGFSLSGQMIQVAVDDEFCCMTDYVRTGSTIVFIPPVAGG